MIKVPSLTDPGTAPGGDYLNPRIAGDERMGNMGFSVYGQTPCLLVHEKSLVISYNLFTKINRKRKSALWFQLMCIECRFARPWGAQPRYTKRT